MWGFWGDPSKLPGPPSGSLRTDARGPLIILVMLVAVIGVPLVVAAILD